MALGAKEQQLKNLRVERAKGGRKQRTPAASRRDEAAVERVVTHSEVDRKLAALDDLAPEEVLAKATFLVTIPVALKDRIDAARGKLGLRSRNEAVGALLEVGLEHAKVTT